MSTLPENLRIPVEEVIKPIGEGLSSLSAYSKWLPEGLFQQISDKFLELSLPLTGVFLNSSAERWISISQPHGVERAVLRTFPPLVTTQTAYAISEEHRLYPWIKPSLSPEALDSDAWKGDFFEWNSSNDAALLKKQDLKPICVSANTYLNFIDRSKSPESEAILSANLLITASPSNPLDPLLSRVLSHSPRARICTAHQPEDSQLKLLQTLGPDRVVFGSGWPHFGEDYHVLIQNSKRAIEWYSAGAPGEEIEEKVFYKNALDFFRLR